VIVTRLACVLFLFSALFSQDISEAMKVASCATDGNVQGEFIDSLRKDRSMLVDASRGILLDDKSTAFQKTFALEVIECSRLGECLDVVVPFVGFVNPLPMSKRSKSGVYLGARTLIAIGKPASDLVLASISGNEDDSTIAAIALVVRGVDGPTVGKAKLEALIRSKDKDEAPKQKTVLGKVLANILKE